MQRVFPTAAALVLLASGTAFAQMASVPGAPTTLSTAPMSLTNPMRSVGPVGGGLGAIRPNLGSLIPSAGGGGATLLRMNQPQGFDRPGCASPDPKHTSSFEFCENGAKAVAWEATGKRCTLEFFAAHTVTELQKWNDYDLEMTGRLTHPMTYDAATDHYVPTSWDDKSRWLWAWNNSML